MKSFLYSWALKVCLLPLKLTDPVNSEHSPSANSWIVTIVGFIACVLFFSWRLSKKSGDEEKKRKNEDLADEGYHSEDSGKKCKAKGSKRREWNKAVGPWGPEMEWYVRPH